jgi:hypothetical protein
VFLLVTVPLSVAEIQWISSSPMLAFVVTVSVVEEHSVQVKPVCLPSAFVVVSSGPETVSVSLPVFAMVPFIVLDLQVTRGVLPFGSAQSFGSEVETAWISISPYFELGAHAFVSFGFVQSAVAQTELAPANAMKAVAATAARPSIFREFILSSFL